MKQYEHRNSPSVFKGLAFAASLCLCMQAYSTEEILSDPRPLYRSSFEDIIKGYHFTADFSTKPEHREISEELFWRYPFKPQDKPLEMHLQMTDTDREFPRLTGGGRVVEHINRARVQFLNGEVLQARDTLLTARASFDRNHPLSRRLDYYLGALHFILAEEAYKKSKNLDETYTKTYFSNGTEFMQWATMVKKDQSDSVVDDMMPKSLYNLAAVYFKYKRYKAAYGAAALGLNYLRENGRKEFRPQLRHILIESYLLNRSYLTAIQEIDLGIRQDIDPQEAVPLFGRAGDIYFDLNNYEFSEDAYSLAVSIGLEYDALNLNHLVLRAESLFWLGRFKEAQKSLISALENPSYSTNTLNIEGENRSYAYLRMADIFLAMGDIEKARLAYFKVQHKYPQRDAAHIAAIRQACLELPRYKKNNIRHARQLLEKYQHQSNIPNEAQELAAACHVMSYSQRERTDSMLERVRSFSKAYPDSRFLKNLIEPVREVQANKINNYWSKGDLYNGISFFELNRNTLFPQISIEMGTKLFLAYVDVFKTEKAEEFYPYFLKQTQKNSRKKDQDLIREFAFLSEVSEHNKKYKNNIENFIMNLMEHKWTIKSSSLLDRYVNRILSTTYQKGKYQILWDLGQLWSSQDPKYICSLIYPTLSKLLTLDTQKNLAKIDQTISQNFPHLFESDGSCAQSILDLEKSAYKNQTETLAEKYIQRITGENPWPLLPDIIQLLWVTAEDVYKSSKSIQSKNLSRSIWSILVEKGPKENKLVQYAKDRLDPVKTEFSKLWN